MRRTGVVAMAIGLAAGCGPAPVPRPGPVPSTAPSAAPSAAPERPPRAAAAARTLLPAELRPTVWQVSAVARMTDSSDDGVAPHEVRTESRARVTWALSRRENGAVRGTGQVDSFTVRTSFDSVRAAPVIARLALEAAMDSLLSRAVTRPPLANECDRPESAAAALARELLVRVPDGVAVGDRWRDSSVAVVCRSGIPVTVHTTIWSTLDTLRADRLVVTRAITMQLSGTGGWSGWTLAVQGSGTGSQRVEMRMADGSISRLDGTSTVVLQLTDRSSASVQSPVPRSSRVVQRVELRAVRLSR